MFGNNVNVFLYTGIQKKVGVTMSYTALYRKLRPKSFREIIGQEPIVRTLQNQIRTNRISHAYLFCGTRGTGKTSMAKIFAKTINCENPLRGNDSLEVEPCDQCRVCEGIRRQISLNVIEIDAASNNGVDNIRDIKEEVKYPPTEGRYKIYIIDEVHMLSTGAFNALLKTLEEPPSYIIFILATTDPQKIPPTILSRCQRFDFRRISAATMVEKMRAYLIEEKLEASEEALQYIARISDGAMRDALSLLDQCLSFYFGQVITLEMVVELVGSVDDSVFYSLSEALNSFDSPACLSIIEEIIMKGRDVSQFVGEFIAHLRNMLVAVTVKETSPALDLSEDNINRLKTLGGAIEKERMIAYINDFSILTGQLKYASNPRVQLEVCCIKLCNPADSTVVMPSEKPPGTPLSPAHDKYYADLSSRIKKLEYELSGMKNTGSDIRLPVQPVRPAQPKPAPPEDINLLIKEWERFTENFTNMDRAMLSLSSPQYLEGQLYLVCNDAGSLLMLRQKEETIKEKLLSVYGKEFQINFISRDEYNSRHKNIYGSEDEEFNRQVEELNKKIRTDIVIE